MGDEGKLPATSTTNSAVPDMTGPNEGTNPVQDDGSKRMGDQGKLPATGGGLECRPRHDGSFEVDNHSERGPTERGGVFQPTIDEGETCQA